MQQLSDCVGLCLLAFVHGCWLAIAPSSPYNRRLWLPVFTTCTAVPATYTNKGHFTPDPGRHLIRDVTMATELFWVKRESNEGGLMIPRAISARSPGAWQHGHVSLLVLPARGRHCGAERAIR